MNEPHRGRRRSGDAVQLLPFGKHVVLLLATTSGVFAFLLDSEGKLAPLPTNVG